MTNSIDSIMTRPVALITGASSGIGKAIAIELLNKGFTVYGTSRKSASETGEGLMTSLCMDITDPASRQDCIDKVLQKEGRIDLLINNAGYGQMGPLAELPADQMHKQIETNLLGPAEFTRRVIPTMMKQKTGLIVNISSISGVMPTAFAGAYCASKAAMNAWSETLRMELAPFRIRVITVQPGAIQSDFGNVATKNLAFDINNSAYSPIGTFILKRAMVSQERATSSVVFAKMLVRQILKKQPKAIIRIGKSSFLYPFMKRWFPTCILDRMISGKFGLSKLRRTLQEGK
jgi:short-subunit dehydrogenase